MALIPNYKANYKGLELQGTDYFILALFTHLIARWRDLFNAQFHVLLYDLTSTYFESNPPWIMDRGIPTEQGPEGTPAEMRACEPAVQYLVGTPKGRLTKLEKDLPDKPWNQVRPGVTVKLLPSEGELYILARSEDRVSKERAMRRRQLKGLWKRLKEVQAMDLDREQLLMKLGAARQQAPCGWRLVRTEVHTTEASFTYTLLKDKLRQVRRREGRYLLRTNLTETDPSVVWAYYMQLVTIEQVFRNLKGDLAIRPIYHQEQLRIEAHIFISFLAYCLHVTLGRWLWNLAPGLTPRSVLEKLGSIQMVDVQIPTSDGRMVLLQRTTQPEADVKLLLGRLKLELPAQPPPRITCSDGLPVPARQTGRMEATM